jgi:hypothetical protein
MIYVHVYNKSVHCTCCIKSTLYLQSFVFFFPNYEIEVANTYIYNLCRCDVMIFSYKKKQKTKKSPKQG